MRWVTCEICGDMKAVNSMPEEGEVFVCQKKTCQEEARRRKKRVLQPVGPFLDVGPRSTTARSRRQVQSVLAQTGGREVPGSGAVKGLDGDVDTPIGLLELKTTKAQSYTLTRGTWEKMLGEAGRNGKAAGFILDLGPHRIAMLPMDELLARLD